MNEVLHIYKIFSIPAKLEVKKLDLKDAKEVKLFKGVNYGL